MPFDQTQVLQQIDDVVSEAAKITNTAKYGDLSDLTDQQGADVWTLLRSTIERFAPPGSVYLAGVTEAVANARRFSSSVRPLLGILNALRLDYHQGVSCESH